NRNKGGKGKFFLDRGGLKFADARQALRGGKKPQPRVQEITLLDRFDDRRIGADKFQDADIRPAKPPNFHAKAKRFGEGGLLAENNVNDCFPIEQARSPRPRAAEMAIRLMAKR